MSPPSAPRCLHSAQPGQGPDLLGHLGPGADLPWASTPLRDRGTAPCPPLYSIPRVVYTVGTVWMQVPTSGGPLRFLPQFLAPPPTLDFLRRGVISARRGFGVLLGEPPLFGTSSHGEPVGIEHGTWFVKLAASRGHCLRPRGSIRRALGVKYHFQSRPGHQGGGGSKAEVAQGGLLRMGALPWGRSWSCPCGELPPPPAHPGSWVTGNRRGRVRRAARSD